MSELYRTDYESYDLDSGPIASWEPTIDQTLAPSPAQKRIRLVERPKESSWVEAATSNDVDQLLQDLKEQLNASYAGSALLSKRLFSPEYCMIIGLGPRAVPALLRDLEREMYPWFWALQSITRQNPAKDENPGDFDSLRESWLEWGRQNRIL